MTGDRLYAWGETHVLVGMLIALPCLDDHWKLAVAIPLAIASHLPLDDLNVGEIAHIYHGIGRGWEQIATGLARVPVWGAIIFYLWRDPLLMACALPAWLAFDLEWLIGAIIGRHGLGLHERMWAPWLKDRRGLLPWFLAIYFLVVIFL